ncbi:unnamed protein product [Albugo candida]|uniref:Uncharacterized protein n=1 Tax=Albugo candida TaxID=65357 RepID=A0A024GT55_9STRA|nr:unnamed protein product [Albugo candida]|eukprot:CCI49530.1 unnamed protein product [Albugo candida]
MALSKRTDFLKIDQCQSTRYDKFSYMQLQKEQINLITIDVHLTITRKTTSALRGFWFSKSPISRYTITQMRSVTLIKCCACTVEYIKSSASSTTIPIHSGRGNSGNGRCKSCMIV